MITYGPGQVREMRGKWQFYVRYKEPHGQWKTVTHVSSVPYGEETRARAEAHLRCWRDSLVREDAVRDLRATYEERLALARQATQGPARRGTEALRRPFKDYAMGFICDKRLGRSTGRPLEGATKRGYLTALKGQILPYLPEGVRVCDVTTEMAESMLFDLQERGYSRSTVRKAFNLMRSVFTFAVERDGLERNPCDGLRAPRKAKPRLNVLSVAGADELARELAGMGQTPAVTSARLALACGLRVGEVAALRLKDCDPKRGAVEVRGAIGRSNGALDPGTSYRKGPKTDASERSIPMNDEIRAIVTARRAVIVEGLMEEGGAPTSALYLVGDLKGGWTTPNNLSKAWTAIAQSLGIEGREGKPVSLHDLRHTFATYALAKKANPKDVQAVMGHSTSQMTIDVYAASDPAEQVSMMASVSHL